MFDVHIFAKSIVLKKNYTFFSSCSGQANIWNMFFEDKIFVRKKKKTFCDQFFYVTKFVFDNKKCGLKKKYNTQNGDQEKN